MSPFPEKFKHGSCAQKVRARSFTPAAVAIGVLLTLFAPGQGYAAVDNPPEDPEVVSLPNGGKLVLPYSKMPTYAGVDGFPGQSVELNVHWRDALKALSQDHPVEVSDGEKAVDDPSAGLLEGIREAQKLRDALQQRVHELFPAKEEDLFPRLFDIEVRDVASIQRDWVDRKVSYLCSQGDAACVFVGGITQRAPLINASGFISGPATFTKTITSTTTSSKTKHKGWSLGGAVNVGISASPPGVNAAGLSFEYSNSVSDYASYAKTTSVTISREIPGGWWGYEQVRKSAGEYTGFFLISAKSAATKEAASLDPGDNPLVLAIPAKVTVKASGDVSPVVMTMVRLKDEN